MTDTSVTEPLGGTIGILGGTFNPPHLGHLSCARHALGQLGLELVLFMPVYLPPHKPAVGDPGPAHRLAMCRLVTAGEPRLGVSGIEIERGGPSYTVDTLRAIHDLDRDLALTFIVGADMARTLPGWRDPEQLLRLARVAVAERDGPAAQDIREILAPIDGHERVLFLDMAPIEVSSSMVRERVAAAQPIDDLVPAAVAGYIAEQGLYRAGDGEGAPSITPSAAGPASMGASPCVSSAARMRA